MADPVLEVYNDAGRLQFALLARLPKCIGKGTHSSATNPSLSNTPGWSGTRLDIANLTPSAFIAIKPNEATVWAFTYVERIGTTNRYNFMTNGAGTFDYWIFDYPPTSPTTSGVMFETYDQGGALLAQIHDKPAVVSGFFFQAINAQSLGSQSLGVPGGRIFAVAMGMRSGYAEYREIGTPDGQAIRYRYFYQLDTIGLSSGVLTIQLRTIDQSNGFTTDPATAAQKWYFGPRNNMVLDVTYY